MMIMMTITRMMVMITMINIAISMTMRKAMITILFNLLLPGKTTILYKLKCSETVQTIPTIGFNVETITPVPGLTLTVWDVGGQERLRALWRHYYVGTEGNYTIFPCPCWRN